MTSCLGIGVFLFPSFHEVTSLHPPSFQGSDFSTCSSMVTNDNLRVTSPMCYTGKKNHCLGLLSLMGVFQGES